MHPNWISMRHGAVDSRAFDARSGSSALLSGYMGKSDTFDRAIASFSLAYADQNENDHAALERAVRKGKVKAVFEEAR